MAKHKLRLDDLLLSKKLVTSKAHAQALIMDAKVLVNDQKITKAGTLISSDDSIRILTPPTSYVSRGGDKIAGAYQEFGFDITNKIALDVGVSTGGFTDFLIQNGAKLVIGVDVGYGIADNKIRQSEQVILLERTNARHLTRSQLEHALIKASHPSSVLDQLSLVVMDLSFISILKVLPTLYSLTPTHTQFIILVKPQFEASKSQIEPGGIIRSDTVREDILNTVITTLSDQGFECLNRCNSPIKGAKGNQEIWLHLKKC